MLSTDREKGPGERGGVWTQLVNLLRWGRAANAARDRREAIATFTRLSNAAELGLAARASSDLVAADQAYLRSLTAVGTAA